MTRRLVAVALFLLFLAMADDVPGFNEPEGFRGLPWRATEQEMRASVSIARACEDLSAAERWQGDRYCPARFLIGDVSVYAMYTFRADKFVRVGLHFAPKDFDRLAAIFVERYGPPTNKRQDIFAWSGATAAIALHRYVGSSSQGYASS
jgi:hypothetical protein